MNRKIATLAPERDESLILSVIEDHISDARAARAKIMARPRRGRATNRPDPSTDLLAQLADGYLKRLRLSRFV